MREGRLRSDHPAEVEVHAPAIWARRGPAPLMERSHRHDDLELNYVLRGQLNYLFGGSPMTVKAGEIAVFWGATPHRLVDDRPDMPGDNCWVQIPLTTVLGWALPDEHLTELLTGAGVYSEEAVGRSVGAMFNSWLGDLAAGDTRQIALLEIHALVLRLLHSRVGGSGGRGTQASDAHNASGRMQTVVEMARFTATHFRSNITVADIARATHLNPNYAMALFRKAVGTTLGNYLSGCRVAEAQRLLLTTAMTTTEIGHMSGFGSQSSFYTHFTRTCGAAPSAYRRALK